MPKITVNSCLHEDINQVQKQLTKKNGFKVTYSQVIIYLINHSPEEVGQDLGIIISDNLFKNKQLQ